MKPILTLFTAVLLLLGILPVMALDTAAPQEKPPQHSSSKTYSTHPGGKPRLSRKCGIYSGICPMGTLMEVGAYCVCNTPSGPIHGVVIP
ncbi:MAG: hypothetical protein KZQ88_07895 [Candidatus Thiodiazotropha sp. (ex Dulcina madagascariensis)]|nr:hypothetical protein [Candidatus Thiodiazotropha sp. (ex Epidulcina cf. delphinae)]MCU7922608.1 hypothetical protein [Candidatus Thiodiazotropha sp. (ex Dulcina madagascariensis)]MCU7926405.1 hypothetical protein [Candidatus Thiodiazotropha sp. (ex Dulcina madagascariensis)]